MPLARAYTSQFLQVPSFSPSCGNLAISYVHHHLPPENTEFLSLVEKNQLPPRIRRNGFSSQIYTWLFVGP